MRLTALSLLFSVAALPLSALADQVQPIPALKAEPRNPWMDRHHSTVSGLKKGDVDILFVGDSITQGWDGAGREIWAKKWAPLKSFNQGISGDRTEHVIWRIRNTSYENTKPKVVVLMIGTNNMNRDEAPDIVAGVNGVVSELQKQLPESKILVLGIFPRGDKADPIRAKVKTVNAELAKLDNNSKVFYLDFGDRFLQSDGTLTREIMPDLLHLSPAGYQIWSDAISDKIATLLKDAPTQ